MIGGHPNTKGRPQAPLRGAGAVIGLDVEEADHALLDLLPGALQGRGARGMSADRLRCEAPPRRVPEYRELFLSGVRPGSWRISA